MGAGKGSEFGYSVKGRLKATMVECLQNNEVDDDTFSHEAVGTVTKNNDLCNMRASCHQTGLTNNGGKTVLRGPGANHFAQ